METFQREVGEWADATFPRSTPESVTSHLKEEAGELRDVAHAYPDISNVKPGQMEEEAADCLLLLLHLAHKMHFSLLQAARQKHGINTGRQWHSDDYGLGYWKHIEPTTAPPSGEDVIVAEEGAAEHSFSCRCAECDPDYA